MPLTYVSSGARRSAPTRPEAPGTLGTRKSLSLAACVVTIASLLAGCGSSNSSTGGADAGSSLDARTSDAGSGKVDGGGGNMSDARTSDAGPGNMDGGNNPDAGGSDASPGNVDGGGTLDSGVPGGAGVKDCVTACETFLMTSCSTPAADFCESAQQSCETRYDDHLNCEAQLEAMDACAATQPLANFTCPLGTVPDEVRPYNLTEDVCVNAANALIQCLNG
jgi:hypothetical protein